MIHRGASSDSVRARSAVRGWGARRSFRSRLTGIIGVCALAVPIAVVGGAVPAFGDTTVQVVRIPGLTHLNAVACPSATTCVAVGQDDAMSDFAFYPVVVPITNGIPGAPQAIAGTYGNLNAVACPSATTCEAVGSMRGTDGVSRAMVVPITDGTPGAAQVVPGVGGVITWLRAVACSSATTCEAVGDFYPSQGGKELVVVPITNGTPGTAQVVPGVGGVFASLDAVACSSATTCVAVGGTSNFPQSWNVVVPITNGTPGTAQLVPGFNGLGGVACPSATTCEAVGSVDGLNGGVVVPITNGTPGSPQLVPGTFGILNAVACPSATTCVAVGSDRDLGVGVVVPITNGTPGAGWTDSGTARLIGVACPSATTCEAVGAPRVPPPPRTITPQSVQGGGFAFLSQTTCTGCPVNTATGEFFRTFDDLSVPGRGIPLAFSRTYSSSAAIGGETGLLGPGWTDSYNWHLALDASGNATVTSANGSSVVFMADGSGGFVSPGFVHAMLVKNGDGTYKFVGNDQKHYVFDASGNLVKETDRNAYATTLSYSGGKLTTVTDPAGRALSFAYDANGKLISVTDPAARKVSFAYDSAGSLGTETDVDGGLWKFTYDSNHLMLTMTDPRGGVTANVYDDSGRVTSQTDPAGRTITFSYALGASGSETTTETDALGNVTQWDYTNLQLMAVTRGAGTPQAATTAYTYDPATLRVASVIDPNRHTTTYTYDAQGNQLSVTDALGRETTYTYDSLNDLLTTTDPLGVTTTDRFDANGNRTSQSRPLTGTPDVQSTTYIYGDNAHPGDITSTTDPAGNVTTMTYDPQGDLVSQTDALGNKTTYAYDAIGRRLAVTTPKGNAPGGTPSAFGTTTTYDSFGEVLSVTDPLGDKITNTYDLDHNLISSTDAKGNTTSYTYDADNERIGIARADGTMLATAYDANGNAVSQTDGSGAATTYRYDPLNRQIGVTDPLGRRTTTTYDGAGNTISVTDPAGQTTSSTFDAVNQRTSITYSDGATPNVTNIIYNADGERTSQTDASGLWVWSWDSLHRLISVSEGANGNVSYQYDLRNLVTQITYPGGNKVSRSYDHAGRWSGVTDWLGNTTTFQYDPNGNLAGQRPPIASGVTDSYGYNNADNLTSIADAKGPDTLFAANYTRDNNNQLTADSSQPASTGSYRYNSLDQLCYAGSSTASPCTSPPGGATVYGHDRADNLTNTGGTTQVFDAANQLCWTTAGASSNTCSNPPNGATVFNSDSRGNRTTTQPPNGAPTTLAYDQANRLKTVTTAGSQSYVATVKSDHPFGYWRFGERAGSVAADSSGRGHDGIYGILGSGHPTLGRTGLITGDPNTAAGFNGSSFAVVPARNLANGTFSLEAWIKPSAKASANQTVLSGVDAKLNTRLAVQVTPKGAVLLSFGGTELKTGNAALTLGATTHVVATYNVSTQTRRLYINGTLKATGTAPPITQTPVLFYVGVRLGRAHGTTTATNWLTGTIDEFAAYATALPPNRVASHYRAGAAPAVASSATYGYNGDGLRMSKTTGGATTKFTWDPTGSLPLLLGDGTSSYIYGPGGFPIEQINGVTAVWVHHDQIGSTRVMTDSTGNNVGSYTYDAYGNIANHTGTASITELYASQYRDSEDGFYYLRARYYDPKTAAFIGVDPLTKVTRSRYGYAADSPLTHTDASGLAWCGDNIPFDWMCDAALGILHINAQYIAPDVSASLAPIIDKISTACSAAIVGLTSEVAGACAIFTQQVGNFAHLSLVFAGCEDPNDTAKTLLGEVPGQYFATFGHDTMGAVSDTAFGTWGLQNATEPKCPCTPRF
jgi:RHS repeat-associated protein